MNDEMVISSIDLDEKEKCMTIQIKLEDKELFDRLDEVKKITGVGSYSEAIRRLIKYAKL
jgi:metal-responsive CopG/Arc/MetJ family transcriptional regulator